MLMLRAWRIVWDGTLYEFMPLDNKGHGIYFDVV
jgi:hypothetical protein